MKIVGSEGRVGQKGFTLIEMSIVLVIIGLIIGGILKGQEIIESSRQKNLIVAFDGIKAAANTFYDRYQALPGDYQFATSRVSNAAGFTNGDGNGYVGTNNNAATGLATQVGNTTENVGFFIHLYGAHLLSGITPSAATTTTFGEGANLPAASFPGSGFQVAYGTYATNTNDIRTVHWIRLSRGAAAGAAAVSPRTAYAVDVKSDDGAPETGTVRADGAAACQTAGAYLATTDDLKCMVFSGMGQ